MQLCECCTDFDECQLDKRQSDDPYVPCDYLTLPESVRKQLDLQPAALVRVTIAVPETDWADVQEAWKLFQQMGRDAVAGRLPNTSTDHDRYLYGRNPS